MRYLAIAIFIVALACSGLTAMAQQPKTLIWTYTDFSELRANAKTWHDVKGIDGFIFCFVNDYNSGPVRWDSGPEKIRQLYAKLPNTVKILKKHGIESNFVHANMDDVNFDWFDQKRVDNIVETFRTLAKVARESGCRGVAIDTESYSPRIWDHTAYPADTQEALTEQIRQTGKRVMDAILSEYPDAELIILPEGSYIDLKNAPGGLHIYHHWITFIQGFVSPKPKQGITVLTECGYFWKDPLQIAAMHGEVNASMVLGLDDPIYWMSKCSIGHGAALFGGGKSDKESWQTPDEFRRQWKAMSQLSTRYRFIFAYESGFTYYPQGADKVNIKSFKTPLPKNADQYFKVLRDSRDPKFVK